MWNIVHFPTIISLFFLLSFHYPSCVTLDHEDRGYAVLSVRVPWDSGRPLCGHGRVLVCRPQRTRHRWRCCQRHGHQECPRLPRQPNSHTAQQSHFARLRPLGDVAASHGEHGQRRQWSVIYEHIFNLLHSWFKIIWEYYQEDTNSFFMENHFPLLSQQLHSVTKCPEMGQKNQGPSNSNSHKCSIDPCVLSYRQTSIEEGIN